MNDDNYVEWLVKRKDPAYAVPVKILMIVVMSLIKISEPTRHLRISYYVL